MNSTLSHYQPDDMDDETLEITDDYKVKVDTPKKLHAAIRWINNNHQYLKINKTILDGFTASAIGQVLDQLSPDNRDKLLAIGLNKGLGAMADIVWKVLKK